MHPPTDSCLYFPLLPLLEPDGHSFLYSQHLSPFELLLLELDFELPFELDFELPFELLLEPPPFPFPFELFGPFDFDFEELHLQSQPQTTCPPLLDLDDEPFSSRRCLLLLLGPFELLLELLLLLLLLELELLPLFGPLLLLGPFDEDPVSQHSHSHSHLSGVV